MAGRQCQRRQLGRPGFTLHKTEGPVPAKIGIVTRAPHPTFQDRSRLRFLASLLHRSREQPASGIVCFLAIPQQRQSEASGSRAVGTITAPARRTIRRRPFARAGRDARHRHCRGDQRIKIGKPFQARPAMTRAVYAQVGEQVVLRQGAHRYVWARQPIACRLRLSGYGFSQKVRRLECRPLPE